MVRGALPGERVKLRILEARRGVARGALLEIAERSPQRVEPACPLVERCGGCPLMPLALDAQRALKRQRVQRALAGLSDPDLSLQLEAAGEPLGYRQRARFGFRRVGSGVLLGYRAPHSKQLVDVERCPILAPELERALELVRARLAACLQGSGEIELSRLPSGEVLVLLRCGGSAPPQSYRACEALSGVAPIAGVALQVDGVAPARFGDFSGRTISADGAELHSAAGSFSQINHGVNAVLRTRVLELAEAEGARVLELYAGQGNFTLELASRAQSLLAIEADPASADACRANLRARGLSQARVLAAQVADARLPERCDAIVLDPPRAGAPELAAIAARVRAERVVYVSCHMTTLGRDLRALHAAGYRVDRAHALDMFPQTAHIEAVARLRRG